MGTSRWLPLSALTLLLLGGCGAGLVTGIAASERNQGQPEARAPELSLTPLLPLVPAPAATRTVVVANAAIPASARLEVRLAAAGAEVAQRQPTVAGQGGSTAITFTLDTAPIAARIADPTAADVPGTLAVLVDGRPVAPAVPIVLARQPRARLDLPAGAGEQFLAPFGERVRLRVAGLRSTAAADLQVLVATADPGQPVDPVSGPAQLLRVATDLQLEPGGGAGEQIVSAVVPGSVFPTQAELLVRDALAGQSTPVANAFYRPAIALALPSQGATTGGSLVTLIGTALVPHDFGAAGGPPPLDFAAVELSLRKGGRITALPRQDFRTAESSRDRLVFVMPPSPDGRPGQVDIVLRVRLGAVTAEVTASQVFLFANPQPFFGPRGAVLDRPPVAVAPIPLDDAPGTADAPDFVVLYDEGGVAFVQLLLAQENGMFQRFGAPRQVADHQAAIERGPRDLCVGDFDGDQVPDAFVANRGSAAGAVHHVVLGQARPAPPLGAVHRFPAAPGAAQCRSARFDGDLLPDVLVVPGPGAPAGAVPALWLCRPLGPGQPAFAAPVPLPIRSIPGEAVEIADLDGDGHLDVAVASGSTLQLDVAFGNGDGTFAPGVALDFAVPGYTADAQSPAVGLHACADGPLQSLGLVLAGLPAVPVGSGPTPPTVAVLPQPAPRQFAGPAAAKVTTLPTEPLAKSLGADLDQANSLELAIAVGGEPTFVSLGLLRFGPNGFQPVPGGIDTGAESPRQIRALHFGRAFPATPLSGEAKAVFVVHESEIDGSRERRLSTRLIYADPGSQTLVLLPPDAGAPVPAPVEGLVGGNLHEISVAGQGSVRDLALARADRVDLLENDGFGGFPRPSTTLAAPGLLPSTLLLLPSPPGQIDRLVFATAGGELGVFRHVPSGPATQPPEVLTADLRPRLGDPRLQTAALTAATRLRLGDVDGDGLLDLVALLVFDLPQPGEGDARLLLLRGRAGTGPGDFPFELPSGGTPVHGRATALALGDFAPAGAGVVPQLELAVAVPFGSPGGALDGDHVRFFRHAPGAAPAADRWLPSARAGGPQVLLAGSRPTEVVAEDFDRDGKVDLLVAAAGDATLRLYRNAAAVGAGEVDVAAMVESLSSPRPLAAGTPRWLRLGDVNGDGSLDAVAAVEQTLGSGQRTTAVAFYLSSGAGEFSNPSFVSPARVGDRDAALALDLGDWNRDGVLDLFLGWDTFGPGDRNVRVLFGGTR